MNRLLMMMMAAKVIRKKNHSISKIPNVHSRLFSNVKVLNLSTMLKIINSVHIVVQLNYLLSMNMVVLFKQNANKNIVNARKSFINVFSKHVEYLMTMVFFVKVQLHRRLILHVLNKSNDND